MKEKWKTKNVYSLRNLQYKFSTFERLHYYLRLSICLFCTTTFAFNVHVTTKKFTIAFNTQY